jgi:hypothetical protein
VGYYPERRPVDVVVDAEPIDVALRTMKSVLDTVRVVEARFSNRNFAEFEQRQRSGAGDYITMADIERRRPISTSDLFRSAHGARRERSALLVRGLTATWCAPEIFVDGLNVGRTDADEMDVLVSPDEIAGVEIYSGATVPVQFSTMNRGGDRCGAIVIWTKMQRSTRNARTKRGMLIATSFVGLSLVAGMLFTRR